MGYRVLGKKLYGKTFRCFISEKIPSVIRRENINWHARYVSYFPKQNCFSTADDVFDVLITWQLASVSKQFELIYEIKKMIKKLFKRKDKESHWL